MIIISQNILPIDIILIFIITIIFIISQYFIWSSSGASNRIRETTQNLELRPLFDSLEF